ncbi:hypothetical protein OJ998_15710 [Solirubrobacter taibaiensis]|nr:hypothetical protein [Solirubrobacter taibaiensis]
MSVRRRLDGYDDLDSAVTVDGFSARYVATSAFSHSIDSVLEQFSDGYGRLFPVEVVDDEAEKVLVAAKRGTSWEEAQGVVEGLTVDIRVDPLPRKLKRSKGSAPVCCG